MPAIAQMIEYLDQNAKPTTTVGVRKLPGQLNSRLLQAALADMLGDAWLGSRPPKSKQQQQPQQQPRQQQPAQPQQPAANGQRATAVAAPLSVN